MSVPDIYCQEVQFDGVRSNPRVMYVSGFGPRFRLVLGEQEDDPGCVTAYMGEATLEDVDPLDLAEYLERVAAALTGMAAAARRCAWVVPSSKETPDAPTL